MSLFEMMMMSETEKQDLIKNVSKDIGFDQEDFENDYSYEDQDQEEVR